MPLLLNEQSLDFCKVLSDPEIAALGLPETATSESFEFHSPIGLWLPILRTLLCTSTEQVELFSRKNLQGFMMLDKDTTVEDWSQSASCSVIEKKSTSQTRIDRLGAPGIEIAVIDSGLDVSETVAPIASHSFTSTDAMCDFHGHGSKVSHTIAYPGTSSFTGRAAGCSLYVAKVKDKRNTSMPECRLMRAIEWSLNKGSKVINISLGYPRKPSGAKRAVSLVLEEYLKRDEMTLIVAAAGYRHHGESTGIADPACADGVVCVAGYSEFQVHDSSTPDNASPGEVSFSACSTGFKTLEPGSQGPCPHDPMQHAEFRGTSAACAFASSVLAQLRHQSAGASRAEILAGLTLVEPPGWQRRIGGRGVLTPS